MISLSGNGEYPPRIQCPRGNFGPAAAHESQGVIEGFFHTKKWQNDIGRANWSGIAHSQESASPGRQPSAMRQIDSRHPRGPGVAAGISFAGRLYGPAVAALLCFRPPMPPQIS
jgi:hypothetical protein